MRLCAVQLGEVERKVRGIGGLGAGKARTAGAEQQQGGNQQ